MESIVKLRVLRLVRIFMVMVMIALTLIGLIRAILDGYAASWTGFGDFTEPNGQFIRGKTLWDWMELFLIPIFLAVSAYYLNRTENDIERRRAEERARLESEISTDRQQEIALQSYLDRMADLLLKEKLRTTRNTQVRNVAEIRTLAVLQGLDARRKGLVLHFLYESRLIDMKPVIHLVGANLSEANLCDANLVGANLRGANLGGADFSNANLSDTDLSDANLSGANLFGANLSESTLTGATLSNANLTECKFDGADLSYASLLGSTLLRANMSGANLTRANLTYSILSGSRLDEANLTDSILSDARLDGVDLTGANLTRADLGSSKVSAQQLTVAGSLQGAILPNGAKPS